MEAHEGIVLVISLQVVSVALRDGAQLEAMPVKTPGEPTCAAAVHAEDRNHT